jgi:hypothetical protein
MGVPHLIQGCKSDVSYMKESIFHVQKILCATSNPFFKISYIHDGCIHLIQACRSVISCRRESTIFHVQKICVLPTYNLYFKFICKHEYLCIDLIQACKSYVFCRRLSILCIPKFCALLASNFGSLSRLFPFEFSLSL